MTAIPGHEDPPQGLVAPGAVKLRTSEEIEDVVEDVIEDLLGDSVSDKHRNEGREDDEGSRGRDKERKRHNSKSRSASRPTSKPVSKTRPRHEAPPSTPGQGPPASSDTSGNGAKAKPGSPDSITTAPAEPIEDDNAGNTADPEAQEDEDEGGDNSDTESVRAGRRRRHRAIELLILAFTRNVWPKLAVFLTVLVLYLVQRYIGFIPGWSPAPEPQPKPEPGKPEPLPLPPNTSAAWEVMKLCWTLVQGRNAGV